MKTILLFLPFLAIFLIQGNAQNSRVWATYYGGAIYDVANCVATDASGNVYLAGYTSSTSAIASGGFQNSYGGGTYDAFLVKFDASGNRLWATYYGNNNNDFAYSIAIDNSGNVYVAGGTSSNSGIASGGYQNSYGGGNYDAFLAKFDSAGNRIWSTYYGGTGWEEAYSVSTDSAGYVYLAGFTNSSNGIASGGFQNSYGGGTYDSFLVKFNSAGARVWATYYGGSGNEGYDGNSVTTDNSGNIYLSGWTSSTTGIASGGFQDTLGGANDAFLVKFDSSGSRAWATYYGGTGNEGGITNILFGKNVATDSFGNVYLSGTTASTSAISSNGFQNTYGGGTYDCYLVKFDSTGNRSWATYYGGSGDERGWAVATDISGNVYLSGRTNSTSGIASNGFQNTNSGNYDAFLVTFSSAGNRLCATYYGGTGGEWAYTPAIDALGNIYLPGFTYSTSGIASGGFQNTFAGGTYDAYLVKLTSCAPTPQLLVSATSATICAGNCATLIASASGGTLPYNYSWNPSGQTTQAIIVCPTTSTTYTVSVTDANSNTATATSSVTVNPKPTSAISGNTTIISGDSTTLTAIGGGTYQWYPSTGLSSITDSIVVATPASTITYCVIVTVGNCSDTSCVTINVIPTGIQDLYEGKSLSISPNPFSSQTILQTNNPLHNATLIVYNSFGQTVAQIKNINEQTITFSRDNLASGLYFVRLTASNQVIAMSKFVIAD